MQIEIYASRKALFFSLAGLCSSKINMKYGQLWMQTVKQPENIGREAMFSLFHWIWTVCYLCGERGQALFAHFEHICMSSERSHIAHLYSMRERRCSAFLARIWTVGYLLQCDCAMCKMLCNFFIQPKMY